MSSPTVSAIILTRTTNNAVFEMTKKCAESLVDNAGNKANSISVIIVESNPAAVETPELTYPSGFETIVPKEPFNFNRFLNIGIRHRPADHYLLCNNDLYFHPGWLDPLLALMAIPDVGSVSPISPGLPSQDRLRSPGADYVFGYGIRQHLSGWCILVSQNTFNKIGDLDESFNFYFADNDYSLELRRNNIKHALSFESRVLHLEQLKISRTSSPSDTTRFPHFLNDEKFRWILESDEMIDGFLRLTEKWGDYRILGAKRKLHDFLFLGLGIKMFSKLLFSKPL